MAVESDGRNSARPSNHRAKSVVSEYPVAAPADPRNVLTVRESRQCAHETVIRRSEMAIRACGGWQA